MSLCFVSNKHLTIPYSDIAKQLRRAGEEIVWLAPSRRWANWLQAEGWPADGILCLAKHADEWADLSIDQAIAELANVEGDVPATIANIIRMCRNLRRFAPRFSYAYLAVARRYVEPFLRDRGVEVVFGEGTWGFEHVTWLVSRRLDLPMLSPAATRVPGDRFYFGDAVTTQTFVVKSPVEADRRWAEEFLRSWLNRPVQPHYMQAHRTGYKAFHTAWIQELFIGLLRPELDRGDATLWSLRARIADRARRLFNATSVRFWGRFERARAGERYVLYPLHHQPESSIDVYGALNSNQVALIETVSRLLPATHKLWVKEHKGGLGDRSGAWYRHVVSLPNVRLIDPYEDIFSLLRNADAVITVSGTAAYEAALLGVPSLGLAPVFFAPLLTNRPSTRSHPLEWHLSDLLAKPRPALDITHPSARAVDFLAELHANSYPGDPTRTGVSKKERASSEYLVREAEGFSSFIAGLRRVTAKR